MPNAPRTNIASLALIHEALNWRYAVKKFDASRRIPDDTWRTLESAMVNAPSSFGMQPWRFVVITDPALKARLPEVAWNQPQPRDCSHYVVFAARKGVGPGDVDHYIDRIVKVRGIDRASIEDYRKMILGTVTGTPADELHHWCRRQCYIALGFLLNTAAMLGVDACPMEGIVTDKVDELLGLPALGYSATVGAALGYRAADDWLAGLPKVRFEASEVVIRR